LRQVFKVNYEVPVILTQQLMKSRKLKRGCSVVTIASTAGLFAARTLTIYCGTKGALIASTRAMALELAPLKARANSIAPAIVRTPLAARASEVVSAESMAEHEKEYPLGFGEPEDVANAAVYLLSPASRWVTGTTLVIDGGLTCQ
jgi:NAD(P)-dependent dehydrogenase (short-subunit alcohol dehydrogenase family)